MQVGFGKIDLTPPIGVRLYGYGPFLCAHSITVAGNCAARTTPYLLGCVIGELTELAAQLRA